METVIINGSPRQNGNGAYLSSRLAEHLHVPTERVIHLSELQYSGCLSCQACRMGDRFCTKSDGLHEVFPLLASAQRIILISPNYMGFVSGDVKQFIDRWFCMKTATRDSRFADGAELTFIFTQKSPSISHGDMAQGWMGRLAVGFGLIYHGVTIPNCSYDNNDGVKVIAPHIISAFSNPQR